MDLEIIIVSEVSQSEKEKFHMTYCLFVESLKNDTNEPVYKTEIDWKIENKPLVTKGERGNKLGVWE